MAKNTSPKKNAMKEIADLQARNEELTEKNRELGETLDAIRSGEVDAIVVPNGEGQKIYTLEGADQPYRVLVENIREGALTLSRAGIILYANTRFAAMVKQPADKVVGTSIIDHVCPEYRADIESALTHIMKRECRIWVRILQEKRSLPVMISMNPLDHADDSKISVVLTDRRKDEDRIVLQARMLDAVGDAVIAADTKNKIIYWNDAATKTYGWEPEDALGRDLIDIATPKISHKEAREIADWRKKGATWKGEYVVKHRDGHEFPIYASDSPIFDDDGKIIAIIGASHDITGQRQTERDLASRNQELLALNEDLRATHEELRQTNDELTRSNESLHATEEELRSANDELIAQQLAVTIERDRVKNLLDIAGVMILALDRKGKVILINRRGSEILGRPYEEIVGKDWVSGFLPEGIRADMRKTFHDTIATRIEDFGSFENPVITRDGSQRDILWSKALIKDGEGRVTGILSSGEDITERKRTEREVKRLLASVRQERERLATLLNSIPDEVWFTDADERVELMNMAATAEFGESVAAGAGIREIAGNVAVYRQDGTPRPVEEAPPIRALRGEVIREQEEIVRSRVSGELHYREVNAAPVKDAVGRIIGSVAVVRDITNRRRSEEALQEKNTQLKALNKELMSREQQLNDALAEKEVLLSEIHHRVKNNLTAFISLLSLEGSYDDSPSGLALKKDLQNRARSMALIHDTLYKTHKFAEVDMKVYLSTLVEQIVNSYSSLKTFRTSIDIQDISLDLNRATPCGLIVNELVTNSLKYAFPPETITCYADQADPCTIGIRMTKDDGTYCLKVFDNGIGLPAEYNPKTAKTLGLKLVNFLAKHQMRAKIEVIAVKGTEYVFQFRDATKVHEP